MDLLKEKFYRVKQRVPRIKPVDVISTLKEEFRRASLPGIKGKRIAIAVPSRKIPGLPDIVRIAGEELKKPGGKPFIVPAMGSHAGGTAEKQIEHLRRMGITEEATGLEIKGSDEVVEINEKGKRFFFERTAFESDFIFLINRIRPHTAFSGDFGSGLMKLSSVGIGKFEGASFAHREGLEKYIPSAFNYLKEAGKILGGIGIVQSFTGEVARIKLLSSHNLMEEEKKMFRLSKKLLLKLPFYPVDLLIVREMGKDISGTGLDTNVIGMERRKGGREKVRVIVVLNLSIDSMGSAYGIGFADVITKKVVSNVNWEVTYRNALSTGCIHSVKIPIVIGSDYEAINFSIGILKKEAPSIILIDSTGRLEYLLFNSEALRKVKRNVEVIKEVFLSFDSAGNLTTTAYP